MGGIVNLAICVLWQWREKRWLLLLSLLACLREVASRKCPTPSALPKSGGTGGESHVEFTNAADVEINAYWVSYDGKEQLISDMQPGVNLQQETHMGHVFTFRERRSLTLMHITTVQKSQESVTIYDCDGIGKGFLGKKNLVDQSRWPEFEKLKHDHNAPCEGPSSNWSCVRSVTVEELLGRDHTKYGFHEGEVGGTHGGPYQIGQTTDHVWTDQQGKLVNCTPYDGGYLKMSMTDKMKKALYPWYQEHVKLAQRHEIIGGGFTNNHVVSMDKLQLESREYHSVLAEIVSEMKDVLQWWTKQHLQHTMTFGLRVYRRGSMLINHLDRQDTHVASAVIQVGQSGVDEGWPLEVVHPHKPGLKEVYMQPGEMVLYEGARLQHGRPMRFVGEEFGNIFSHFVPDNWHGVGSAMENPHFRSKPIVNEAKNPFQSAPRSSMEL